MNAPTLYRVDIGDDCYIGSPDEVLAFMMKADGAPPGDAAEYMEGIATRVAEALGRGPISTASSEAFLESLSKHKIARVSAGTEPSTERVDPADVLKDGPIAFGPDVDPSDIDY